MRGLRGIRHRLVSGTGIAAVAVTTLLALLVQDRAFDGWRLDLTEDGIWTLSDGTHELLAQLETDVELSFYFSRSVASDAPEWSDHARFVADSLIAFVRASDGRLALRRIDPRPLSEAAAEARAAGLEPVRLEQTGEELFLGLVARAADGREGVLARIDPADAGLLEYRIAQLLEELLRTHEPRLALISGVALTDGARPDAGRGAGAMRRRLEERFELLVGTPEEVGSRLAEADVLMLVHPRGLPEEVLWAVDQFALTGGRILLLVDPLAERDPAAQALAFANPLASRASNARALLQSWGVSRSPQVVLDAEHAMPVTLAPGRPPVPHLAMLALRRDAFASDAPVTARLDQLNLSTAGALQPLAEATTRFEPLVTSARASSLVDPATLLRASSPAELSRAFRPDTDRHVLAARISGPTRSAFAQRPGFDAGTEEGDIEVLVVADTDLLADALWLAPGPSGTAEAAWAGNADFVVNAIDQLAGSDALLGIRGQPHFVRPLDRLEGLRREAELRLRPKLAQLEGDLLDVRAGRRAGMEHALQASEQARLREEIRSVQRALRADVDRLTGRAELFGVFAAPLLVLCVGALVALWRRRIDE